MMTKISKTKISALLTGCLFLSTSSPISADDYSNSGLTPELLRPKLSQLTPEAASLGRYGAFLVSEYSGAANISIPLYTVNSGAVSFPISLNYDGTGIKVEQDATTVGLGWNLSYGGLISHIICGEDDFREYSDFRNYVQNYWKNKNNSLPQDQPCQSLEFVKSDMVFLKSYYNGNAWGPAKPDEFYLYYNMSRGYDSPDVFQASFCGHNVSFVIDKRLGKDASGFYPIVILNDNARKYKISYELGYLGAKEYPLSFSITDDKGITYKFSKYSENYYQNQQIDSYYLTKIYGPDGETGKSVVSFEYSQISAYYGNGSRPTSKSHMAVTRRIFESNDDIPNIAGFPEALFNLLNPKIYSTEVGCGEYGYCYKVYPKSISTVNETIEFQLGSRKDLINAKKIESITIKTQVGNVQRKISFGNNEYFEEDSPMTGYSGKRLKLTSVTINDHKYNFEYDSRKLPAFSSYSKDYWGYYNGANPNVNNFIACTPAYNISNGLVRNVEHLGGSNRLASENLCNVGMLKKVVYPTGGYSVYDFEANRFNDKYYYPDASHRVTASTGATSQGSLSFYGSNTPFTKTFKLKNKATLKIDIIINSLGSKDTVNVIVRDSEGKEINRRNINGPRKEISEVLSAKFAANEQYTVEVNCKASKETSYSSAGNCIFTSADDDPVLTLSPEPVDKDGGYSIGGGLRIRSIKNYDSDNKFLNGVKYRYSGGRLLSPTVQLEKHFVDFQFENPSGSGSAYSTPRFSFLYANTEPSYPYICSLGIPATVGYDRIVKEEIDKDENVLRKTILLFHNYGYITEDVNTNAINSRMQNAFYFNSYYSNNSVYAKGHLNGNIKDEFVYYMENQKDSVIQSHSHYEYRSDEGNKKSVLYPKCIPTYLPGYHYYEAKYDLAFYRKFILWSYLTGKTDTLYNNSGSITNTSATTYSYNSSNYQASEQTVSDGLNTLRTRYYYPSDSDNRSSGLSNLTNRHNLSEVTAIDNYKNGYFVGGSTFNYTLNGNLPVVCSCYSILPNSSKTAVLEMAVTAWDGYGNIREYKLKNGTPVTVLWSYSHRYPVMEIVGKTYSEVKSAAPSAVTSLEAKAINESISSPVQSLHTTLKNSLSDAYVTAVLYDCWFNLLCKISPTGYVNYYNHDGYGRLQSIVDPKKGVLQKYNYNYKNK